MTAEQRRDVALVLAQVGVQDSALAGEVVRAFTEAMTKSTMNGAAFRELAQGLSALAARL